MSEVAWHFEEGVGIVGLGYVGLPLAVAFAEAGLPVVGVEADPDKLAALAAGDSYVEDVPSERLWPLISSGVLRFTDDCGALGGVGSVLICLPTPLDDNREPDLSILVSGARAVLPSLRPGTLVVLESTTYPGTTREVLLPMLEKHFYADSVLSGVGPNGVRRSGASQDGVPLVGPHHDGFGRVGRGFFLAFSPERIDPGNRRYSLRNTPKVVGGVTPECARRAAELYGRVIEEVHVVSGPEAAEMTKLLENVFRGVNIALVNELAILCDRMGVDVWEVIGAAETKPFGFMPFFPGPGLGGHCIPIDPFYLSWRARAFGMSAEFIELAGRINANMPGYAVGRIAAALNDARKAVNGSRVLLVGVGYKPNVGDLRGSPALAILEQLRGAGAEVSYHDPHVPHIPDHKLSSVELTPEEVQGADCVVIATDHDAVGLEVVVDHARKVVDLRNAVRNRLGRLTENVEVL